MRIARLFTELVKEKPTPDGFNMIPGLFSWASTIAMGKEIGATPNGRHAGGPDLARAEPRSRLPQGRRADGDGGRRRRGAARLRQHRARCRWTSIRALARDEEGIDKVAALIRTHFDLGGTQINLNVMDKQTDPRSAQGSEQVSRPGGAGDRLQRLLRQPVARVPADRGGSHRLGRIGMPSTPQVTGLSSSEVQARRQRGLGNTVKLTTSRSYKDIVLANILGPVNVVLYVIGLGMILVGDYRSALFTVGLVVFNAAHRRGAGGAGQARARSHRAPARAPR